MPSVEHPSLDALRDARGRQGFCILHNDLAVWAWEIDGIDATGTILAETCSLARNTTLLCERPDFFVTAKESLIAGAEEMVSIA